MTGRPPNPIDPEASAAARLGYEIRTRRIAEGWTLEVLAARVDYTPQHISAAEQAKSALSKRFVDRVDAALRADGRIAALLPDVIVERAFARHERANASSNAGTVGEDVRRKTFLGLGLIAVLVGPDAAARTLTEVEGEQVAADWSHEVAVAADRPALMPALRADLKQLAEHGGPQGAIAQLSLCAAMIALSAGEPADARRWWSRAHVAARASGDPTLAAYIAGQHAYDGVYALYAPAQALALAERAAAITDTPCAGRMHALGAKARALALLGRRGAAREAVRDLEREYERLPRSVTTRAIGGWDEQRLHHAASFVVAFGGVGSPVSHDDALASDAGFWRDPPQIELHRAAAEADAAHAVRTLVALSDAQRGDRFIHRLGARTAAAIESSGASAGELRETLALTPAG